MTEDEHGHFAFRVDISGLEPTASLSDHVGRLRSQLPDIDLLPPPREGDRTPALLDHDALEAVVRAGYTVTITGIAEGPPDPDMVMSDEEADRRMTDLVGEERAARGKAD